MNINSGKSIQNRIQDLQKSSDPQPIQKAPIETGISKEDFAQRKDNF